MGTLIVDDQKDTRKLIKTRLKMQGCTSKVYLAADGYDAVRKYKKHRDVINIIFLDMNMPKKDGPEALADIRELDLKLPVYAISAYSKSDYAPRLENLKLTGWISKLDQEKMLNEILFKIEECEKLNQENDLLDNLELEIKRAEQRMFTYTTSTNTENFLNTLLAAKTVLALGKYPRVLTIFEKVFLKEVPSIKMIVEKLEAVNIDKLVDTYMDSLSELMVIEKNITGNEDEK